MKQKYLIFFLTLAAAAAVLAWQFYINKGTLKITGSPPFTITVAGSMKKCADIPCSWRISPGEYTIIIRKEGFIDDIQTVKVQRWRTQTAKAELIFIPVVREAGDASQIMEFAPLRPPFLNSRLENFPKNAKNAVFSASGELALVTVGKELFGYDSRARATYNLPVQLSMHPAFLGEDIIFLEETDAGHTLKFLKNGAKSIKDAGALAVFPKKFANPELFGSYGGKFALINDVAAKQSLYLVDAAKKTRTKLPIAGTASKIKMAASHFFFETAGEKGAEIFAFNMETREQIPLPAVSIKNLSEFAPGGFLFAASENQRSHEGIGKAISEIAAPGAQTIQNTNRFITLFDTQTKSYRTLVKIELKQDEEISRLTADPGGKKIYFVKGEKLFEIALGS